MWWPWQWRRAVQEATEAASAAKAAATAAQSAAEAAVAQVQNVIETAAETAVAQAAQAAAETAVAQAAQAADVETQVSKAAAQAAVEAAAKAAGHDTPDLRWCNKCGLRAYLRRGQCCNWQRSSYYTYATSLLQEVSNSGRSWDRAQWFAYCQKQTACVKSRGIHGNQK